MRADEKDYRKHIARTIIESMIRDFPEETSEELKEFKVFTLGVRVRFSSAALYNDRYRILVLEGFSGI